MKKLNSKNKPGSGVRGQGSGKPGREADSVVRDQASGYIKSSKNKPGSGVRGQGSEKRRQEAGSGIGDRGSVEPRQESSSGNIRSYRDLDAWKKAMDLVVECYQNTKKFPKSEIFALSSQLERAAVSVAANIAEGRSRGHTKEFLQHLSIAYGSLAELETHLQIAERLHYITTNEIVTLMDKTTFVGKLINGLRRSLEKRL